jgi:hypothetical protein
VNLETVNGSGARGAMLDLVDTAAGCAGATFGTLGGLPFDVVKSRLQARGGEYVYTGVADCFAKTVHAEGVQALYRGVTPALSSALAENSVGITVQRSLRRALGVDEDGRPSIRWEIALGAMTGVFTSIAICPFEVLKVRLQLEHGGSSKAGSGLAAEVRRLVAGEGVGGLYRGIVPLIGRDVPFNALFYGSYESLCTAFMRLRGSETKEQLGTGWVFLSGGLAGCAGWSLVIPLDVVKTRLQSGQSDSAPLELLRSIAAAEGAAGLFRGWTAAIIRAFPTNAFLFLGVELTTRLLRGPGKA